MIGVVLWSDPAAKKAVLWCEDQGDLAYFDGKGCNVPGAGAFAVGDMVAFDVVIEKRYRKASNASLVQGQVYDDLQSRLKEMAAAIRHRPTADILPFKAANADALIPSRRLKA